MGEKLRIFAGLMIGLSMLLSTVGSVSIFDPDDGVYIEAIALDAVDGRDIVLAYSMLYPAANTIYLVRVHNGSVGSHEPIYQLQHEQTVSSRNGLFVGARGDEYRVLIVLDEPAEPSGFTSTQTIVVIKQNGDGVWSTASHLIGLSCCTRVLSFAVGGDGTSYTLIQQSGRLTLITEANGDFARTHIANSSPMGHVSVDQDGQPHVCYSDLGKVIDWSPAGSHVLYERNRVESFDCNFIVTRADLKWGVFAALPKVGGSCLTPLPCLSPPDSGKLIVFSQDGQETSIVATNLSYWTTPQLSESPMGRRLIMNYYPTSESFKNTILEFRDDGLVEVARAPTWSWLPRSNIIEPVVLHEVYGQDGYEARLVRIPDSR